MNANDAFPSEYLKHEDLGTNKPIVTIESITFETFGQGEDSERKPVISFVGKDKRLTCNKTNWNILIMLLGSETDFWMGKKIQLQREMTTMKGKPTPCIRINSTFIDPTADKHHSQPVRAARPEAHPTVATPVHAEEAMASDDIPF